MKSMIEFIDLITETAQKPLYTNMHVSGDGAAHLMATFPEWDGVEDGPDDVEGQLVAPPAKLLNVLSTVHQRIPDAQVDISTEVPFFNPVALGLTQFGDEIVAFIKEKVPSWQALNWSLYSAADEIMTDDLDYGLEAEIPFDFQGLTGYFDAEDGRLTAGFHGDELTNLIEILPQFLKACSKNVSASKFIKTVLKGNVDPGDVIPVALKAYYSLISNYGLMYDPTTDLRLARATREAQIKKSRAAREAQIKKSRENVASKSNDLSSEPSLKDISAGHSTTDAQITEEIHRIKKLASNRL